MNLIEIASLLGSVCSQDKTIAGIGIDSRKLKPGELFIAIRGKQFDGHDYIQQAANKGALAVICEQPDKNTPIEQIRVPDTVNALAMIATLYRQTMPCPAIALTGSNGKTTVKEMIANILPAPAHATPGNFNNELGVPLSLFQLKPQHRYAVFELGANHAGEIAKTVSMVQPQVTLINNIAPAHIEGFGSIDGVAHAKGEIHQGLMDGGTAIINDDDDYAHFWDSLLKDKKVRRFSCQKQADVTSKHLHLDARGCARFVLTTPEGKADIQLEVPGMHNVSNALAAAACTGALGISLDDISTGLASFKGVSGRMTYLKGKNRSIVIDDTYNANLRSVLTAIEVLSQHKGQRILVFGDMGELGQWSQKHHQQVGEAARQHGIDMLLACGTQSKITAEAFGEGSRHYASQLEMLAELIEKLDENTTVLVKGSRAAAMEKVVQQLVVG